MKQTEQRKANPMLDEVSKLYKPVPITEETIDVNCAFCGKRFKTKRVRVGGCLEQKYEMCEQCLERAIKITDQHKKIYDVGKMEG